jgi:hypothetical protein
MLMLTTGVKLLFNNLGAGYQLPVTIRVKAENRHFSAVLYVTYNVLLFISSPTVHYKCTVH